MHLRLTTAAVVLNVLSLAMVCTAAAQTPLAVLPLWPHALPEPAATTAPEVDVTKPTDALISGHRTSRITNVTHPTLTVLAPAHPNGTAALVFPGGSYVRLAWDGEGLDSCTWLNSIQVTCLLVKYRVPQPAGDAGHYPGAVADLEDAQQAMRLARAHAADWHIDPNRIGVVGFSAGGNLAVLLSTHPDDHHVENTPAAPDVPGIHGKLNGESLLTDPIDARANFAIIVYPAYLVLPTDEHILNPIYTPNTFTPPTFLIQAENDKQYGRNAPVYFQALAAAGIAADLHMYATGGHGFGLHPPGVPEEHWTDLATAWLRTIKTIP